MTAKAACGCQKPSSGDTDGTEVVWHDPTKYDPVLHGPPYLPPRLAAAGKRAARRVAASKVSPRVARRLMGSVEPLSSVLATLRAASFLHQTHHWQTRGPMYYADHLLFDRLYSESQAFIDQVGERAVGLGTTTLVDSVAQARQLVEILSVVTSPEHGASALVDTSLRMESLVLSVIDEALQVLRQSGALTNGTENLLQGVSDLHESFVYLLQQRVDESYDYGR